jgi:hypothetical protein
MCNHCDNAPCVAAGKGAVEKREDGIVVIVPEKAKGRKDLVEACPYGNIWWNEEENVPQHWTFDAHLIDQGWKEPRASHACPTQALQAVKCADEAMQARAARDGLEVLAPERGTKPRVWYRNLHRITREFVAGTVLVEKAGVKDIVEGASVTLTKAGTVLATTTTDMFGDFRFDGLAADDAEIEVRATAPAGKAVAAAKLAGTVVLPPLILE